MNSKEYWGLAEAYSKVYAPQKEFQLWVNSLLDEGYDLSDYTWEDMYEVYVNEDIKSFADKGGIFGALGRAISRSGTDAGKAQNRAAVSRTVGNINRPITNTMRTGGLAGKLGRAIERGKTDAGKAQNRAALLGQKPAAKPAPTPAAKPAPAPAARPAATTPKASPAPTPTPKPAASGSTKTMPTTGSGYKKDTSITDMIGRSQVRQGAPINTGNKSSDIRAMAARSTVGSTPTTSPKSTPTPVNRATGSKKPGSVYSGFDMFDLVKGHLLDEGYADSEEAAIAIMANMSEEWRESILSEAPGEWFGGLRDKARASRASQMQSAKPTPKPGPTVSSPFAKPASTGDSGRLTTYGAGGGSAAERGGKTRSQVMHQGAKNLENKNRNPGPNFGR